MPTPHLLEQIFAPFTSEQVQHLNEYQCGVNGGIPFHPFTCRNRGDGNHGEEGGDRGVLVATESGWVCPHCDYTQNWAHADMAKKPLLLEHVFKEMPEALRIMQSMQQDIEKQLARRIDTYRLLANKVRRDAGVMLECLLRCQEQVLQDASKTPSEGECKATAH